MPAIKQLVQDEDGAQREAGAGGRSAAAAAPPALPKGEQWPEPEVHDTHGLKPVHKRE